MTSNTDEKLRDKLIIGKGLKVAETVWQKEQNTYDIQKKVRQKPKHFHLQKGKQLEENPYTKEQKPKKEDDG